jgi:hypothetical protein
LLLQHFHCFITKAKQKALKPKKDAWQNSNSAIHRDERTEDKEIQNKSYVLWRPGSTWKQSISIPESKVYQYGDDLLNSLGSKGCSLQLIAFWLPTMTPNSGIDYLAIWEGSK